MKGSTLRFKKIWAGLEMYYFLFYLGFAISLQSDLQRGARSTNTGSISPGQKIYQKFQKEFCTRILLK